MGSSECTAPMAKKKGFDHLVGQRPAIDIDQPAPTAAPPVDLLGKELFARTRFPAEQNRYIRRRKLEGKQCGMV
jgi:hypothetical protein